MLIRRGIAALCVAATTLAGLTASQEPVFRSRAETVPVYATVLGPDDALVTNLSRDDFQVFDNGRLQPITQFSASLQPIHIIVMLDMSGSMSGNLDVLRRGAVQMFTRLLPGDEARVGNFGDRIVISPTFTNDVDTLIRTLYLDLQAGGPTPLWGAVNAAMAALARADGRRVVLVLSDGKDSGAPGPGGRPSGPTLAQVIQRAQAEDFMVYAIGLRSREGGVGLAGRRTRGGTRRPRPRMGEGDEPDPGLRELATESGGGYFALTETTDLGEVFARVADELHRQYLIGYAAPENDGRIHQVELRTSNPTLRVQARHSYRAASSK